MGARIEARGLSKQFGEKRAVDGLSLSVDGGEIYALVGPDGAGKTTTMRLLCGALSPDAGEVCLGGYDLQSQTEAARSQIGYLAQRFSLYRELTVMENLRFFAEVRGVPSREWRPRTEQILAFVGLEAFSHRRADALSGGMKQKLGLAAALVHRPPILLLDEPTGGVDAVTRQAFWQLLIQLLQTGVAVLISTPYMDEAMRASKVGFMINGKLKVEGSPGQITARLRGQILEVHGTPRKLILSLARSDPAVKSVQAFGDRLHLTVQRGSHRRVGARLRRAIRTNNGSVESIELVEPTLEDVFLDLLAEVET